MKLIPTAALPGAFALGLLAFSHPLHAQGTPSGQPTTPGMAQGQAAGSPQGAMPSATPGMGVGAQQSQRMNEEQMKNALRGRGYSDLQRVEREGDEFKVGEARRFGERVENLRVNARTGEVRDEARLNEEQVKTMLRDRGFSEVRDVSRDGDTIRAKAKRNDREVNLRIDARSGAVTQQQASN